MKVKDKAFIYTLSDPVTGAVRYVGKTLNLKERFGNHKREKLNTWKANWVSSLASKGLLPVMEPLEEWPAEDVEGWQNAERFYISYFRFLGFRLCNLDAGGGGVGRVSAETRAKISKGLTGKPKSEEAKRNHAASMAGKFYPLKSAAAKAMCKANVGRQHTEAHKSKQSSALIGVPHTAQHTQAVADALRGQKLKPESIAKRTAARILKYGSYASERRNRKIIDIDGVLLGVSEWSKISGISPSIICKRLRRGWTNRDAVYKEKQTILP